MIPRSICRQLTGRSSTRGFSTSIARTADFTHAVIGGGAVGLAIARKLAIRESGDTVLLERNDWVGMETSSRNSEVIHAGLYYGPDSLKTRLCIQGKQKMYAYCKRKSIPHKKCGKWIIAQTSSQYEELVKVHEFSQTLDGIPTEFVSLAEASKLEPSVQAKAGILSSPTTGIVDSDAYMQSLLGDFDEKGGLLSIHTNVIRITPLGHNGSEGWEITVLDKTSGDESTITAETIVNSAGLGACDINNMILPKSRHRTQYYAKGNYFSYSSPHPRTTRLIYPAPEPGLGGLGTHLTLDMRGSIRFGPDIEWVDSPTDLSVSTERLDVAIEQIKRFLPDVKEEAIGPDYAGIRPKLVYKGAVGSGKGFVDFVIRKEEGYHGFVNLLGIESPGLTSSLAIGEMVEGLLYGEGSNGSQHTSVDSNGKDS